jgi:hypothetical protein
VQAGAAFFNTRILAPHALAADGVSAIDRERMDPWLPSRRRR